MSRTPFARAPGAHGADAPSPTGARNPAASRGAGAPLAPPAGAQGPGELRGALVEALDLLLARRASGVLAGERRASGRGDGTELAQIRPYQVGDDVRKLDAAASARTGVAHVREEVPERALTTWVLLDVSASMAFGTGERLKSDVAAGVVDVVGRLSVRRAGRVALLTCGAPVQTLLPPRSGRRALLALRRAVAAGVAPDGTPPPADALAAGLRRIGRLARGAGLVVVVSDFREAGEPRRAGTGPSGGAGESRWFGAGSSSGASESRWFGAGAPGGADEPLGLRAARPAWSRALGTLARRHDVLAVEVTDPREAELPDAGQLELVDPETGARMEVDTAAVVLRRAFAAAELERRDALKSALRRARARHVVLNAADRDWLRALGRGLR
jgi:uncharacterized protein (DUF58 family)